MDNQGVLIVFKINEIDKERLPLYSCLWKFLDDINSLYDFLYILLLTNFKSLYEFLWILIIRILFDFIIIICAFLVTIIN